LTQAVIFVQDDMQITKPTFVVAELPRDVAAWVRVTRLALEPAISHLPPKITLAGSSGVGPIAIGQSIASVRLKLEGVLEARLPFEAVSAASGIFQAPTSFSRPPSLSPSSHCTWPLSAAAWNLARTPFPYRPHGSLKGVRALQPGEREALDNPSVPTTPFTVRTVSVYEMDRMQPNPLFSIEG